jgi:hypothetical protein
VGRLAQECQQFFRIYRVCFIGDLIQQIRFSDLFRSLLQAIRQRLLLPDIPTTRSAASREKNCCGDI